MMERGESGRRDYWLIMSRVGVVVNPVLMAGEAWNHDVFWLCWGAFAFACCLLVVLWDVYVRGALSITSGRRQ